MFRKWAFYRNSPKRNPKTRLGGRRPYCAATKRGLTCLRGCDMTERRRKKWNFLRFSDPTSTDASKKWNLQAKRLRVRLGRLLSPVQFCNRTRILFGAEISDCVAKKLPRSPFFRTAERFTRQRKFFRFNPPRALKNLLPANQAHPKLQCFTNLFRIHRRKMDPGVATWPIYLQIRPKWFRSGLGFSELKNPFPFPHLGRLSFPRRWKHLCLRGEGNRLTSWDEKPYEILSGGRKSYLDEQDIATFVDPPKELAFGEKGIALYCGMKNRTRFFPEEENLTLTSRTLRPSWILPRSLFPSTQNLTRLPTSG